MRKLFVLCMFLIVAVASTGMVFAASQDIGGHSFNVPDGFNEVNSSDSPTDLGTLYNKVFQNSKGDIINITVLVCTDGMSFTSIKPTDPGSVNKTINGAEGFFWDNSPTTHKPTFTFVENNNQRLVSVSATNANDIEACLK